MDYDFINNYTESFSVSGNSYTIIDSLNLDNGSFNTKKITYTSYTDQLNSIINTGINLDVGNIETNIDNLISKISNKFDKRGLSYNANEKITGPLAITSKLSVNNFSVFDSNLNLKFNKVTNLSVISPIDDYDAINKKYVDDLVTNYETPDISNFILKSGDTMTGLLTLNSSTPTDDYNAIHKKYVDDVANNYNVYVKFLGDTLTGNLTVLSPVGNTNPSTKKYVDDKLSQINYALKTGSNITGELFVIPLTNSSVNYIANKKYVDDKFSSSYAFVSTTGSTMTSTFNVFNPLDLNVTDPNLAVSKFYVDNKVNQNFLRKTGGTLSGNLILVPANQNIEAVTKEYVDNKTINTDYVLKTGSNVTGQLVVNPLLTTSTNFVANKKYVDDKFSTSFSLVCTTGSNMTSTFNVFNPLDLNVTDPNLAVSKFYVDKAFDYSGKFVLKSGGSSGGSMTGPLTLSAVTPILTAHAVTKEYIDNFNYNEYLQVSGGEVEDFQFDAYESNYVNINYNYFVTTFAGSADILGTEDGTGTAARFRILNAITIDSSDNLYVCDGGNHTIRKITPAGVVTTFAGTASLTGTKDGIGTDARFKDPRGITIDSSDNLYVCDSGNHTIRKITPTGEVTTIAGTSGSSGSTDGTGTAAKFNFPIGITVDSSDNNLYVCDTNNKTIRKISTSTKAVTTFAGTAGTAGYVDDVGSNAKLTYPYGIIIDSLNNLYITENSNHTIRKITPDRVVSTFAGSKGFGGSKDDVGTSSSFNTPTNITINSSSDLYVCDWANHTIRKITPAKVVTTFAGTARSFTTYDHEDGIGSDVKFNQPTGITIDSSGNLFITQRDSIRKININSKLHLNYNTKNNYYINLNENLNGITIYNIDTNKVYYFTLFIKQKGSYNLIWNVNGKGVRWENGESGPSISKEIDNVDVFTLIHMGGEWFGINGGQQYD